MPTTRFAFFCAASLAFATPAAGQAIDELRVGVAAHNVRYDGEDSGQSDERGPSLELEIVAPALHLDAFGAPRPFAMASINLNGDTSYAAAGLLWRWRFAPSWTLEPSLGAAVHDGALDNPYPAGDPRADDYAREHQLLGTRVLFREALALERRLDDRRSLGIVFEHLSNGGALFGNEDNQSLNEIALRYTLRR
jgi:hypothetical protein